MLMSLLLNVKVGKMKGNLIYDLVLLEADRIVAHKMKDPDLYYKDFNGSFEKLAEPYSPEVQDVINEVFKRRRMRYMITFNKSLETFWRLKPSATKLLCYFSMSMGYGNIIKGHGFNDISAATGMNKTFITKGINELCEEDLIRFKLIKGRRTYMVNPAIFYKGTIKQLFNSTKKYEQFPLRDIKLNVISKGKAMDIFG